MRNWLKGTVVAFAVGCLLALNTGCESLKAGMGWVPSDAETIQQGYYEIYSHWLVVKETAVQWAESPAGQANPAVIDEFMRIDETVQEVLDRTAELFCLASAPTPDDPAPPPLPDCVPITGLDAENAYLQAASAMRVASAELRRYLAAQGVER